MTRWIPLLALLLLGCPKEPPPTTSGAVADDRPAFLGLDRPDIVRHQRTIERKLALLSTVEGPAASVSQRRLEAALVLLQDLAAPAASAPRDQERASLKAFASYLDAMLHAEPTPQADEGADDTGLLVRAAQRAQDGAYMEALELGGVARDDLYAVSSDSTSLLRLLAEWALEADRPDLALDLLTDALRLNADRDREAEGLAALHDEATEALLGPSAAALQRGRNLAAGGDLGGAADAFREAIDLATDEDEESMQAAAAELDALVGAATARADELMDRVDVLLAGEGPYDHAGALLADVEALPEAAVDDAELLRLRAWYRSLTSEDGRAQADADHKALQGRLQSARDLVAAGQYRDAVLGFRGLEGTPLQGQARQEARTAVDELVREERERAGRMFVAARKQQGEARGNALQEVRRLLQGLLDEFPDSGYAGRVADNLAAVDRELGQ